MEKNNFDDIANELDEKIAIAEEKDVIKQYLNLLEDNDVKEYIELINKRRSINDNIIRFEKIRELNRRLSCKHNIVFSYGINDDDGFFDYYGKCVECKMFIHSYSLDCYDNTRFLTYYDIDRKMQDNLFNNVMNKYNEYKDIMDIESLYIELDNYINDEVKRIKTKRLRNE